MKPGSSGIHLGLDRYM